MEENIAVDPGDIGLLGSVGVVLNPKKVTNRFEQIFRFLRIPWHVA